MSKAFPGTFSKANHGTRAGFLMHKACGSVVCDPCREANNKEQAEYMRKHYDPVKRRDRYLMTKAARRT